MDVLEEIETARDAITVKRVYGDPVEKDGLTVIPAATVRGRGRGGSLADGKGGAAFGLVAAPVGAWILRDGKLTWKPAVDVTRVVVLGELVLLAGLLAARRPRRSPRARMRLRVAKPRLRRRPLAGGLHLPKRG